MTPTQTFRVTVVDAQGVVLDIYEAELPVTDTPDANTARAAVLDVAESIRMGLA